MYWSVWRRLRGVWTLAAVGSPAAVTDVSTVREAAVTAGTVIVVELWNYGREELYCQKKAGDA